VSDLRNKAAIWSIKATDATYCGLPVIRAATADFGEKVLEIPGDTTVWGWTPPGDLRAAEKYGKRLIADVELAKGTPAKPSAGWTYEIESAELLAALAGGVTSYGFLGSNLRDLLAPFAKQGGYGYPQVYDSDRSTDPRPFLRKCVENYQAAGFDKAHIVPLLGLSAGPDHVAAWLDECGKIGVQWQIWSVERAKSMKWACPIGVPGKGGDDVDDGGDDVDDGGGSGGGGGAEEPGLLDWVAPVLIALGLGAVGAAAVHHAPKYLRGKSGAGGRRWWKR